jgi:hypothetical protein
MLALYTEHSVELWPLKLLHAAIAPVQCFEASLAEYNTANFSSAWRLTVKSTALLTIVMALCLCVASAKPQTGNHHFPTPPEPLDQKGEKQTARSLTRHVDFTEVQREADDLARTAQTIPPDVASIRRGMLPKDTIEKLKQIEKLSKRLRTELNP